MERSPSSPAIYTVSHLERWPLGTRYGEVLDQVETLYTHEAVRWAPRALVVDRNGVGAPIVEQLEDRGLEVVPVFSHGGHAETVTANGFNVPVADLAAGIQVLLGARRLRISQQLEHAQTLVTELKQFRVKVRDTGTKTTQSFEAFHESDHDDLVFAVALAIWYGERVLNRLEGVTTRRRGRPEEAPIGAMRSAR